MSAARPDFPLRFGERLAFLDDGDARDVIRALAHEVRGLAQDLAALVRHHGAPLGEILLRGFERAIQVLRARVRQLADGFAGGGIDHGLRLATAAGDPFARDEQLQIRIGFRAACGRLTRLHLTRLH